MPLNLDPGLRRACDANVQSSCAAIARGIAGGGAFEVGTSLVVRTGLPSASFNPVFALDRVRDPYRLIEQIRARLVAPGIPWQLITPPDVRLGLTPVLDAFGLVRRRVYPVMVLDLEEFAPPPLPAALSVREVSGPDDVRRWGHAFENGVDAARDFLAPWIEGMIARPPPHLRLYFGCVDDQPVATAARFTRGPIAGVYFVQTHPEHRRRGYGRALTAAAADGRPEGSAVSCLQATDMGRPLYESMGYRAIGEYEFWQVPAPAASAGPGGSGLPLREVRDLP